MEEKEVDDDGSKTENNNRSMQREITEDHSKRDENHHLSNSQQLTLTPAGYQLAGYFILTYNLSMDIVEGKKCYNKSGGDDMNISPMVDFAFKCIFGSEVNKSILIDFLNATISGESKIKDLTIIDPFNLKEYIEDKLSILDVKAKLDDGSFVNVEVQITDQKNMQKRTLFYWSKLYTQQLTEGERFHKLEKTIAINIMNFELLKNTRSFHTTYHLREDKEAFVLTDVMEIHMIEVPKIINADNIDNTLIDWVLFLQDPKNKNMEVLAVKNPQIKKAMTVLEFINSDKKARALYEAREKELRDRMEQIEYAKELGLEQGLEQGIEQGIEQGKLETILNFLKAGVSDEVILKATKINKEELKKLKEQIN